ncbi:MAG: hypothetical protein M9892_07285 [Bacteroidetes bacterium]|nr:hypothetical protein [Bacteroidota bacterium]
MKEQIPTLQQNQKSYTFALKANPMQHNLSREYGICFCPFAQGKTFFRSETDISSNLIAHLTNIILIKIYSKLKLNTIFTITEQ